MDDTVPVDSANVPYHMRYKCNYYPNTENYDKQIWLYLL